MFKIIASSQPGSEVTYVIFRANDVWYNLSSENDNTYIHSVIYHFQSNFMLAHWILMSTFWEEEKKVQPISKWTNFKAYPLLPCPEPHSWEQCWDACPGLLTGNPVHWPWFPSCWLSNRDDLASFYLSFKQSACLWPPFPNESHQWCLSQRRFYSLALSLPFQKNSEFEKISVVTQSTATSCHVRSSLYLNVQTDGELTPLHIILYADRLA